MSKRRINHRQAARIAHKHCQLQTETLGTTTDGLIIKRFNRHALVETAQGDLIRCAIRPNIGSLVAGDRIVLQSYTIGNSAIISRYPRQTILERPDKYGQLKIVAANINQIMIVIAPQPEISWPLLDSYLIMAEFLGLQACIVLNKVDLACMQLKQRLLQQYQGLGYKILYTSAIDQQYDQSLIDALATKISVFVGQSGVGKSSLIINILPLATDIQAGAISTRTNLGRHTTNSSRLYHLPHGGSIIDSPGVREFGLYHMSAVDIARGYREFEPYISQCKFRNCRHYDASGCALLLALDNNLIARDRYENYIKILAKFSSESR